MSGITLPAGLPRLPAAPAAPERTAGKPAWFLRFTS